MREFIAAELSARARLFAAVDADPSLKDKIEVIAQACVKSLRAGNKILFAGNGGSAADAQHLSAELVSRFLYDRPGLPSIAITTDTSALTAIGNDYGFERLFARQLEALGKPEDVLIAFSTSGRSPNILAGLKRARELGIVTVGFSGQAGGDMKGLCDLMFRAPSTNTALIQEVHMTAGHIVCGLIEAAMFPAAMMQAVILCGGRGTRLGNSIGDLPKAMAPVAGKPFLEYVLAALGAGGFDSVTLATGYRRGAIRAHFGAAFGGISIAYSEETEPLGTGGAAWQALALARPEPCFILNGDTWVAVDFAGMLSACQAAGAPFGMAAQPVLDIGRYGALDVAGGRVAAFREKGGSGPGLINAGVYLAGAGLRDRWPMPSSFSLERDFLEAHLRELRPLAWPTAGEFIDIGVPQDLEQARRLFAGR